MRYQERNIWAALFAVLCAFVAFWFSQVAQAAIPLPAPTPNHSFTWTETNVEVVLTVDSAGEILIRGKKPTSLREVGLTLYDLGQKGKLSCTSGTLFTPSYFYSNDALNVKARGDK